MCSYEYSMYDLICDVISSSVRSCSIGKINVYDKICDEKQEKSKHIQILEICT